MLLGIHDRIALLNILPVEGDIVTVRILKKLKEELGFTEAEFKDHKITQAENRVMYEETGYKVEIGIGEKAKDIIVSALKKHNTEGRLREEYIPLYDTFVGAE